MTVYRQLRQAAIRVVGEVQRRGIGQVELIGGGDAVDILRLTCLEHSIAVTEGPTGWAIRSIGSGYEILANAGIGERETG